MRNLIIAAVALVGLCGWSTRCQTLPERVWIAGRYDGNRVIIYFDAVKFNNTVPTDAPELVSPVANGFFPAIELPEAYIANLLKAPDAHRFALGDEYDVLTGGDAFSVKLTTLVGAEGDEGVGNSSYVGALATVVGQCPLYTRERYVYYVVRLHREPVCGSKATPGQPIRIPTKFAELLNEPVRFATQTQMVSLLTERMRLIASDLQRHAAEGHSPSFAVQPFRVADGSLRYYGTAQWKAGPNPSTSDFSLGAWFAPQPTLHVLAVEANQYRDLPQILNVAGLDGGRTALILRNGGVDSTSTDLVDYRDGLDAAHMPKLQSIAAAE
jgi:hypothetical protein